MTHDLELAGKILRDGAGDLVLEAIGNGPSVLESEVQAYDAVIQALERANREIGDGYDVSIYYHFVEALLRSSVPVVATTEERKRNAAFLSRSAHAGYLLVHRVDNLQR